MPVILDLTEYEAGLVVDALMNGRAALMKQWGSLFALEDGGYPLEKDAALENMDENIAALGWVRKRLESAIVETPPDAGKLDAVWHHQRGWIHPVEEIRKTAAAVEAVKLTREDVADAMRVDLAEVDAANAKDKERLKVNGWTVIPDGFEVTFCEDDLDGWPFDVTDPEDKIVIASADTQTDGTVVGFHTYPTEADNIVSKGIWGLITRDFSAVSDRDIRFAEKALRSDPMRLAAIKSSVEGLQKAYAQDGKVKIDLNVGGRTTTINADPEDAARLAKDLDLAQRAF
ncbi:hypothetical protein GOL99_12180 [Sinorhizobium medicae]|nr:hypothetical protein [Sinorhizobium medicae]